VLGLAEYLSYKNKDTTMGANIEHARWAFYGLIDQTLFGKHHIWVGGGKALEGTCSKFGGMPCITTGLSAVDGVVGYIYRASKSTDFWAAAYRISNDFAASYTTSPATGTPAPGTSIEAFGLGILYTFSAKVVGPPTRPAPPPGPVPAATPTPAPTNEPGAVPPPNAAEPPPNPGTPPPPTPPPHS
jgi:hypothetical protein